MGRAAQRARDGSLGRRGRDGLEALRCFGAYIDRMSDYCAACAYDVKVKSGPDACPFNYLYWNFLIQNEERLAGNQRMAMPYRTLRGLGDKRRAEIRRDAAAFLDALDVGPDDQSGDQTDSVR